MVVRTMARALAPVGLNLVGVAAVAEYDAGSPPGISLAALAPGSTSAIVLGNGGRAFWEAFRRERWTTDGVDPLDAFTRRVVEEIALPIAARSGAPVRVVYPFDGAGEPVSFMRLAACAGLGQRSLLGLLVHPVYGPWIALRAALLVPGPVTAPRPADGFDPCPSCTERPCIGACPAAAVSPEGWDVPRCGAYRARADDPCAAGCHARLRCVLGRPHQLPHEALAFHQRAARPGLVAAGGSARQPPLVVRRR
jgi:hypothetical protein